MKPTLICIALLWYVGVSAQMFPGNTKFTRDDTLRGSITKERSWWDLKHYQLSVNVLPVDSAIFGSNRITYKILSPCQIMQIDMQSPMSITRITQDGKKLDFTREGNAFFVKLRKKQKVNSTESIEVFFKGKPHVARRAPWDGGLVWSHDTTGKWFIASACQGLGASAWWPCKDHMYDEPDSMSIAVTAPAGLTDVSNGRLRKTTVNPDSSKTFEWIVKNPINNYGVNVNIGNYVHFGETFHGEKGPLDVDYYVLPENLAKAKEQFRQVPMMLKAFEHWFGPYPFYEDGYKLVEAPYLGMEHQSSVTYGNGYKNGYLGKDRSSTGWGNKFDFIIIHESGHEWFANSITCKDIADMWIHESFTNYSESLYVEYYYGKEAGAEYVRGCRKTIQNKSPIMGIYNVNREGSGDMYNKGGNMIHTIRQLANGDERWRQILRGLNTTFYHQTVTTIEIENYLSSQVGIDLNKVFDQYLRDTRIPVLEYRISEGKISYRWANCVEGFNMPIKVHFDNDASRHIKPVTDWKTEKTSSTGLKADENFYIEVKKTD